MNKTTEYPRKIPRKRFGQHFLQDGNIIRRIVNAACPNPNDNDQWVEIGPGTGALTFELLTKVKRLDAVEVDRDLIERLRAQSAPYGELTVHQGDALKFDFATLAQPSRKLRIIGNLPYNITSPLLFHLLDQLAVIQDMHFMLQKEVVDRLAAGPGNKVYGRLSVMVQYFCEVESLFDVPPTAFYPPPKVDSAVVRLTPHDSLPALAHNWQLFSTIVREAFCHRRKTLRKSLGQFISTDDLERVGISPLIRPEQLSVADFVKIANQIDYPRFCNRPSQ